MSNVTLTISGRTYTVSCAPGEEAHVAHLGELIDAKVADAGVFGQSESRMLLFAALLLADDLHNASRVEPAKATLPADLLGRLDAIADSIENLADLLEPGPPSA